MRPTLPNSRQLSRLQRATLPLMAGLVLLTFMGANLHALLWQSSQWLVSAVLPGVVVDLTNEERVENAAAPLVRNAVLDAAAKLKAEHMAKHEYFAHFSPDGVSPWHWFREAGYVYAHAGENLAIHFTDTAEVIEAWMDSPLHRKNIVDKKFTEIGVGTAKGEFEGYETVYVVQLFGAPAVPPEPEPEPASVVTALNEPPPPEEPVVESPAPVAQAVEVSEVVVPDPVAVAPEPPSAPTGTAAGLEDTVSPPADPVLVPEDEALVTVDSPAESTELPTFVTEAQSPVPEEKVKTIPPSEVVVVEMPTVSTSSGLAVATVERPLSAGSHAGATLATLATQPNTMLQLVYMVLATVVVVLLLISIGLAYRRLHYVQVAYGFALLAVMGGLWFVHDWLTGGAVVV